MLFQVTSSGFSEAISEQTIKNLLFLCRVALAQEEHIALAGDGEDDLEDVIVGGSSEEQDEEEEKAHVANRQVMWLMRRFAYVARHELGSGNGHAMVRREA